MPASYCPARGDVVWISFDPQAGHEQAGRRPAVIISPESYNRKVGLTVLCIVSAQRKGYPFEVDLPRKLNVSGVVLADQVKSMDWKERQNSAASSVVAGSSTCSPVRTPFMLNS